MNMLGDWLGSLGETDTKVLVPAVVSLVVSALVSYLFKRFEQRDKLSFEYKHEQQKMFRQLIGRYHGRLMSASSSLNQRMWNLYQNAERNWHTFPSGVHPSRMGYYLPTTVHRFFAVQCLLRRFELQAIVLDARIAERKDFTFVKYARMLQWVMSDVDLFAGISYDASDQSDHFFSDSLRMYCDDVTDGDDIASLPGMIAKFDDSQAIQRVFDFFNGISRPEQRLRWDRIVCLHLLLLAFLNRFGFETDYSNNKHFLAAAREVQHAPILDNLVRWLGRFGLARDKEARRILRAARSLKSRSLANGASKQDAG